MKNITVIHIVDKMFNVSDSSKFRWITQRNKIISIFYLLPSKHNFSRQIEISLLRSLSMQLGFAPTSWAPAALLWILSHTLWQMEFFYQECYSSLPCEYVSIWKYMSGGKMILKLYFKLAFPWEWECYISCLAIWLCRWLWKRILIIFLDISDSLFFTNHYRWSSVW